MTYQDATDRRTSGTAVNPSSASWVQIERGPQFGRGRRSSMTLPSIPSPPGSPVDIFEDQRWNWSRSSSQDRNMIATQVLFRCAARYIVSRC